MIIEYVLSYDEQITFDGNLVLVSLPEGTQVSKCIVSDIATLGFTDDIKGHVISTLGGKALLATLTEDNVNKLKKHLDSIEYTYEIV